ncbi:peptidylprolyl isomerase [Sandaracinobacteroides saxicola]|uniref:Peptidylprolyl isomerase n=1 Tax=Sandaracinobacteroides saxicola TaxID=2759707 RepID=A0A7G5II59_9SPHN|nr:peptidylprolyl isomerase [Sandaracinobacteroides saxicola]QMW23051.1 peptidylprolyl isomerase [Sandaracinobacteroides saxicola]
MKTCFPAVGALLLAPLLLAAAPPAPSPNEVVAQAPAADWITIPATDLLVMDLPPLANKPRRVVIQLIPLPFSMPWVANVRRLARAAWYDGTAIVRVQDNYVTQWGDPDGEDPIKAKRLPPLLSTSNARYTASPKIGMIFTTSFDPTDGQEFRDIGLQVFYATRLKGLLKSAKPTKDPYAPSAHNVIGWPLASDGKRIWPVHCYGMVGVGRGMPPDAGSGAELYTVIGHAPRHLDRNIALVGRVVQGIEHLSSLPRGTGPLGFYETPAERTPITRIRLASDLPATEQPRLQYLSTESASFDAYAAARANRRDRFFIHPAGGADICNIPVPIRTKP